MASARLDITSESASLAMIDGLTSHVRAALKARIMERLQPDIDAAIEAGLESFKAAIVAHKDPLNMGMTIKILVERKSPKEPA